MAKHAIFLSGPVGVGKTTLGRALAERLSGAFIEGDTFSDSSRPWYCSILHTSRSIVQAGSETLKYQSVVVVAYPLTCINWIYFRRQFEAIGAHTTFVGLQGSYAALTHEGRGRTFSASERDRIRTMIDQGYGAQTFSDILIDNGRTDVLTTLERLEREVRSRIDS